MSAFKSPALRTTDGTQYIFTTLFFFNEALDLFRSVHLLRIKHMGQVATKVQGKIRVPKVKLKG